jgi:hypothetical protein
MAHRLPSPSSPLREAFEVTDLVAIGTRQVPPTVLREALASARRTFTASEPGCIHSIFSIVLEADDRLSLIEIGPRGGWKRRHTFGWGLTGNGRR